MDPLKLDPYRLDYEDRRPYHGERAVDPLKLHPDVIECHLDPAYHGERAVDPLKLFSGARPAIVRAIPRRASRGPIEASSSWSMSSSSSSHTTASEPWTH